MSRFDIPRRYLHTPVHALRIPLVIRRQLWQHGIEHLRDLDGVVTSELALRCGLDPAALAELVRALSQPATLSGSSADVVSASGVDRLPLTDLVRYRLTEAGFHTVGDIASAAPEELLRIPGLGLRRVEQMLDAIARLCAVPRDRLVAVAACRSGDEFVLPSVDPVIIAALAAANSLEDEIYALSVMSDVRNSTMLLKRWGLLEWPPPVLDSIGAENGLTRERARQIIAVHEERLASAGLRAPIASAMIELLDRSGGVLTTDQWLRVIASELGNVLTTPPLATTDVANPAAVLRVLPALANLGLTAAVSYHAEHQVWVTASGERRLSDIARRFAPWCPLRGVN